MRFVVRSLLLLSFGQMLSQTPTTSKPNPIAISDTIQPEAFRVGGQEYLTGWTNWQPTEIQTLLPLEPIDNFGKLSSELPEPKDSDIYVIHIANFEDNPKEGLDLSKGAKVDLADTNWFFYRYGSDKKFHQQLKADKKAQPSSTGIIKGSLPVIYGVKNGYLISVSVLRLWPTRKETDKDLAQAPDLKYTITPVAGVPGNITALKALVGAILNASQTGNVSTGKLARPLKVTYNYAIEISVSKISERDLKPPYKVTFTTTPSTTGETPGDCHNITAKTTCPLTQTLSITDIEYWNVGINVVAYGPLEKKYALNSSNVVTMSKTRHMPLYGVFDVSPWAKKCPMVSCPYFQGGLPLNGAPLHLPYVGMAWGLPFMKKIFPLSVYGGVGFMKQTKLNGLPVGSTSNVTAFAAAQQVDWAKKPLYGVEIPVSSIVSKIKSSVGSGK